LNPFRGGNIGQAEKDSTAPGNSGLYDINVNSFASPVDHEGSIWTGSDTGRSAWVSNQSISADGQDHEPDRLLRFRAGTSNVFARAQRVASPAGGSPGARAD
jgi:hypothetical protein